MLGIHLTHVYSYTSAVELVENALTTKRHLHIVSLNPENIMSAQSDSDFQEILNTAEVQIIDGVGILLASHLTGENKSHFERVTGIDLMIRLISSITKANHREVTVGLLGGRGGVARQVRDILAKKYVSSPHVRFVDLPESESTDPSNTIHLKDANIDLLFVAFGSPTQEKWIWQNRKSLSQTVCMGVGGAFDMLTGRVPRAPALIQKIGLEWLYRLIAQPWRLRRQIRLLQFIWRVFVRRK